MNGAYTRHPEAFGNAIRYQRDTRLKTYVASQTSCGVVGGGNENGGAITSLSHTGMPREVSQGKISEIPVLKQVVYVRLGQSVSMSPTASGLYGYCRGHGSVVLVAI